MSICIDDVFSFQVKFVMFRDVTDLRLKQHRAIMERGGILLPDDSALMCLTPSQYNMDKLPFSHASVQWSLPFTTPPMRGHLYLQDTLS